VNGPLSEQQLVEIAARAEAATRGPWGIYDDIAGRMDIAADLKETGYGYSCRRGIAQVDEEPIDNDPDHADWDETADLAQCIADATFIANAREDVPALLAEVKRLHAVERHAQKLVDGWKQASDEHAAVAKSGAMADMPGMSDKQEGRSLQLLDCADELADVLKGEDPDDWEYGIGLDVIDRNERSAEAGEQR
jgi:hypothetical protein